MKIQLDGSKLIQLAAWGSVAVFFNIGGQYLAVTHLSNVVFVLTNGFGMFIGGWITQWLTIRSFKESDEHSLLIEAYRAMVYGFFICLVWTVTYLSTPYITPLVPSWLIQLTSMATSIGTGSESSLFLMFCIIFVLVLIPIGAYGKKQSDRIKRLEQKARKKT